MSHAFETARFKEAAARAIADPELHTVVSTFQKRLQAGRFFAAAGFSDFDALRDLARDVRDDAIAHLPDLLELFERQVESRGGRVHWARDGLEARAIILKIAQDAGAKSVVKSKSMVSEEIELGAAFERAGLRSIETDLGEYIIQLRDERPSHLIGPALHLTRAQIEGTFRQAHAGLDPARPLDDRKKLIEEAREVLRADFASADLGVTGANFLVAETGSAVVITNEGNADLSAALPKTHIVLTGIEKVVPTFEDASLLIRLLTRSATGQDMSAYASVFSGPRQPGESAGPTAFHVVLLDNGRANMVGTEFQDALRCIRCAACLNHCPVFGAIGGHGYGSVYSGPIGAVLSPALVGIDQAHDLPEASTMCGRCEEVCPVRIPLPKMLRHWREREFERHLTPKTFAWATRLWGWVAAAPWRYALASRLAGAILPAFADGAGWIKRLPAVTGGWTRDRDMRVKRGPTFQSAWAKGRR